MANTVARDAFQYLVNDLKATHGDNLAAVVLYGSAAAGDFVPVQSDYNILIALHRITPQELRLSQAPVREWQRLGHPLPVYFTFGELRDAADVFPIEFHEMESARVVLYGRDPFDTLQFSDVNLRHQTEYELRSKLIQLRRLYIPASASARRLQALLSDSLKSFAALFAAVLRLHGQEPPATKQERVRAAVRLLGLDAATFERVFELRGDAGDAGLDEDEANELFASYMEQIEHVIEAVDRVAVSAGG